MPSFDLLGPLMRELHQEFVRMYYLFLPVCFALALVITWFKSPQGGADFLDVLKRAFVSSLLLIAFPDISDLILSVTDGISERIDQFSGLDTVIRMAELKSKSYSFSATSILLQFNDLLIAVLSFLSFMFLYIARYLTVAMYHFFWAFLSIVAPILLLFHLFQGTSHIAKNLFRSMIEVACWKCVWAILGAMLQALSFGDAYQAEGSYITLIVMNFVISFAMLGTPMFVRSLVGSGIHTMSSALGASAVLAATSLPKKLHTVTQIASRSVPNKPTSSNHPIASKKGSSHES